MPLPKTIRGHPATFSAHDAIEDFEINADSWDGIDDAFLPIRTLVHGDAALIPEWIYQEYIGIKARVTSRVSLVEDSKPRAFFCTTDVSKVPRWIFLEDAAAAPETDLLAISKHLRSRLGPEAKDLNEVTPTAERILAEFLNRLSVVGRLLLSRRKRRALDEMELVLAVYLRSASMRQNQPETDLLSALLKILKEPGSELEPDWEELASRWLDLIRLIWYQKLQDKRRRKPLLLKGIRKDVIAAEKVLLPRIVAEFTKAFPAQRSIDERVVACIVGV